MNRCTVGGCNKVDGMDAVIAVVVTLTRVSDDPTVGRLKTPPIQVDRITVDMKSKPRHFSVLSLAVAQVQDEFPAPIPEG